MTAGQAPHGRSVPPHRRGRGAGGPEQVAATGQSSVVDPVIVVEKELNMIAWSMIPATCSLSRPAWMTPAATRRRAGGAGATRGDECVRGLLGVVEQQLVRELAQLSAGQPLVGVSGLARTARPVVLGGEDPNAFERVVGRGDLLLQVLRVVSDRLLEHGEQQLVLAREMAVEGCAATSRLVATFWTVISPASGLVMSSSAGIDQALDPLLGGFRAGSTERECEAAPRSGLSVAPLTVRDVRSGSS